MLEPGTRVQHYEILEPIGRGGMGEVYRARDTKLGRDVAIKALPEAFSRDADRLARFDREAKLLASVNHANIATLYGLEASRGQQFLAMELVDGETLEAHIERGALSVDEAVSLFVQLADGLEAAHDKGVIHRDLKPANIKLTADGTVKILDFGLAKAFAPEESASAEASQSPTLTKGTALGAIMGTASYMSPEQARGKPVDQRTDIWAMGVCLFEALAGQKPFAGDTVTDILAAVVNGEPRWASLPSRTPASLRRLLSRCLTKNTRERLHHAADARLELTAASDDVAASASPSRWLTFATFATFVSAAIAVLASGIAAWSLIRAPRAAPADIVRTAIPIDPELTLGDGNLTSSLAISPDGRHVAYIARSPGSSVAGLYLRPIDSFESRDDWAPATQPFFSPDSRWLGFVSEGRLTKVAVTGGASVAIANIQRARGASWSEDGTIVYVPSLSSGLWRVSADGGEPEALTTPDRSRREKSHRYPQVLPGGGAVLFTVGTGDIAAWDDASVEVLRLDTGERRVLIEGGMSARYVDTGHIVYGRANQLLAVPFDLDTLELTGSPVPVVDGVRMSSGGGNVAFGVTRDGTLLYARQAEATRGEVRSVRRDGNIESSLEVQPALFAAVPSPDGRYYALWVEEANGTILVYDTERETSTRLATGFDNHYPVWTPDGERIAFRSNRDGPFNLYWQAADGSDEAERLTRSDHRQEPHSFSPDGKLLAYTEHQPQSGADIFILPIDGETTPEPYLQTRFQEDMPVFSPDGRFIAYQSDESGELEVYVETYPRSRLKWRVSSNGGEQPRWNPRGKELFYRKSGTLMAVAVDETDEDLSLGTPQALFGSRGFTIEIMPDGQSFLTVETPQFASDAPEELVLVQHWTEELKRLVPVDP